MWGVCFWTVLFGILGARFYHVIDFWTYYKTNLLEIFKIWNGGLGIWGGIFGGTLGAYVYLKIRNQKIISWLDNISISIPLGQAIGRWGNFFNKEILGLPTKLPWGMFVEPKDRPSNFSTFPTFHPLFLYESILCFLLFTIMISLYKKYKEKYLGKGFFVASYLFGYSLIRFSLDFLRLEQWVLPLSNGVSLNVSQCISILNMIITLFIFYKVRKSK
jgi:phosphatidylglycerol:prolipoprotein diacylglycerol transferase